MSAQVIAYEVKVRVHTGREEYNSERGLHVHRNEIFKMLHVFRRTPKQAAEYAKRYGKVISVTKADPTMMFGNIEMLPLQNEMYGVGKNPYPSAIAMNDMIWMKKRNRRSNGHER